MEEQLLIARQARHADTTKTTLVPRLWRVVEMTTTDVGLATMTGCIENHRVNVYPTPAFSD
jgi:hypothetical protein